MMLPKAQTRGLSQGTSDTGTLQVGQAFTGSQVPNQVRFHNSNVDGDPIYKLTAPGDINE